MRFPTNPANRSFSGSRKRVITASGGGGGGGGLPLYSNVIDEMDDSDPLTTTSPDFGPWEDPDGGTSTDFLSNGTNISDRSLRFSHSEGDDATVQTNAGGSNVASPSKIRGYFYIHQIGPGEGAWLTPQGETSTNKTPFYMNIGSDNDILLSAAGNNVLSGSWTADTLYRVDFTEISWGSSGTNVKMEVINEDTVSSLGSATDSFIYSVDGLEQLEIFQFTDQDGDTVDVEWYGFSYE